MYLVRPPLLLKWIFPNLTWRKSSSTQKIYLTFDDGPIPEITPFILDTLAHYNVKATFFCVGENIIKYPDLFKRLIDEGHTVGNHTHNHLKGYKHDVKTYTDNIKKCQDLIGNTKLFRPPYGRIKKSQVRKIEKNFDIIMWDVLSGDFDTKVSPQKCYQNVIRYTRNGSIIVFHDNLKAIPKVQYALPRAIEYFLNKGYQFGLL